MLIEVFSFVKEWKALCQRRREVLKSKKMFHHYLNTELLMTEVVKIG